MNKSEFDKESLEEFVNSFIESQIKKIKEMEEEFGMDHHQAFKFVGEFYL